MRLGQYTEAIYVIWNHQPVLNEDSSTSCDGRLDRLISAQLMCNV